MLGTTDCTQLPLAYSESTLIETVTEKLKNTTLIRSIATHFTDDIVAEVVERLGLATAGLRLAGVLCNGETAVKTDCDCHYDKKKYVHIVRKILCNLQDYQKSKLSKKLLLVQKRF